MGPLDKPGRERPVGTGAYSENFRGLRKLGETNDELGMMLAQIKDMMKDSVVVDLGAGEADVMAELAKEAKARQYIGVDIRARQSPAFAGATYVQQDLIPFLEGDLPPGRHVIICNGIDQEVTGLVMGINYHYLAKLIDRGTAKRDIIFGMATPTIERELLALKDRNGQNIFTKVFDFPDYNFFIISKQIDSK